MLSQRKKSRFAPDNGWGGNHFQDCSDLDEGEWEYIYQVRSEPLETKDRVVLDLLKEMKDEVLTILPENFHRFYLEIIHPMCLSLLLNCNQSGRQLLDRTPLENGESRCTEETIKAAIILGLKQHFDWLILKYRAKIFLHAPELISSNLRFTDLDWVVASVRHAFRLSVINPPYRKILREFIRSMRKKLPLEYVSQFYLMIDLMGNTQGYETVIDRQMVAPYRLFAEATYYKYTKEQALYYLSLRFNNKKNQSLDHIFVAGRSGNENEENPLGDYCLHTAIEDALRCRDLRFFVQIGDAIRNTHRPTKSEQDMAKLQLFLIQHWILELRGVGPLFTMSINDLVKTCEKNGFGNQTAFSIEKTRQRLGLMTIRNGKPGTKDYILNW